MDLSVKEGLKMTCI